MPVWGDVFKNTARRLLRRGGPREGDGLVEHLQSIQAPAARYPVAMSAARHARCEGPLVEHQELGLVASVCRIAVR